MALDKAIKHGKEHRKEYRGAASISSHCRCHGICSYCESNRRIADIKAEARLDGQEDEYFGYWFYPDGLDVQMDLDEEQHKRVGLTVWMSEADHAKMEAEWSKYFVKKDDKEGN
jgi:elongation factor P hydroxylase